MLLHHRGLDHVQWVSECLLLSLPRQMSRFEMSDVQRKVQGMRTNEATQRHVERDKVQV